MWPVYGQINEKERGFTKNTITIVLKSFKGHILRKNHFFPDFVQYELMSATASMIVCP